MESEKIKSICESHGIDQKGATLFNDDYIISKTGDLICGINWSYSIWDNQLTANNWLDHLQQKKWYNPRTFIPAYIEALCRQNQDYVLLKIGRKELEIEPFVLRKDTKQMNNIISLLEIIQIMRYNLLGLEFNGLDKKIW